MRGSTAQRLRDALVPDGFLQEHFDTLVTSTGNNSYSLPLARFWMETTETCPAELGIDAPSKRALHPLLWIVDDIWHYAAHNFRAIRREFGWGSWLLSIWRQLRVFAVLPDAIALLQTPSYAHHAREAFPRPLLHFCSARYYLRKGLSTKERIDLARDHVDTEHSLFGETYFSRIYEQQPLQLWSHHQNGHHFHLMLKLAGRALPEGDLQLTLLVDDEPLHKVGFSWMSDPVFDAPSIYVARNQSRWRKDTWVLDAFEAAFPNNSAMMFTYAALQGMAKAAGSTRIMGVRTEQQIAHKSNSPSSFSNSYTEFWKKLGGADDQNAIGISIPIPFFLTPIHEVASKHRRRAIQRREYWANIEASSERTIASLMRQARWLPG